MGAQSAGLGCGTTVYFELPLFCAAMAGKAPLAPLNTVADQTSPPLPAINDVLSIGRESSSALPWELEEIGPRISVRDTANAGDGDDDVDAIPAMEVRRKPKPGSLHKDAHLLTLSYCHLHSFPLLYM